MQTDPGLQTKIQQATERMQQLGFAYTTPCLVTGEFEFWSDTKHALAEYFVAIIYLLRSWALFLLPGISHNYKEVTVKYETHGGTIEHV